MFLHICKSSVSIHPGDFNVIPEELFTEIVCKLERRYNHKDYMSNILTHTTRPNNNNDYYKK